MDIMLDMCSLQIENSDELTNVPTSYINKYKWKNYLNRVSQFIITNNYKDKESLELIYLINYMLDESSLLDIVDTYSNTTQYSKVLLDIYNKNKNKNINKNINNSNQYITPEYMVDYC